MPSFDIVSDVDIQEVDNAVNQTSKEIGQRFDFRGSKSSISFDRNQKKIALLADDDFKMRTLHQLLEQKLAKRSVDIQSLKYDDEKQVSGNMLSQCIHLKVGLEKEDAKKITKLIKDTQLKVQAQIQDDQVRVTGKKIDDLQQLISRLKSEDVGLPLQFINMRK